MRHPSLLNNPNILPLVSLGRGLVLRALPVKNAKIRPATSPRYAIASCASRASGAASVLHILCVLIAMTRCMDLGRRANERQHVCAYSSPWRKERNDDAVVCRHIRGGFPPDNVAQIRPKSFSQYKRNDQKVLPHNVAWPFFPLFALVGCPRSPPYYVQKKFDGPKVVQCWSKWF